MAELRTAADAARVFCRNHQVNLDDIEAPPAGSLDRLTAIADAVDRLISRDATPNDFLAHARRLVTLYQAVKPDAAVLVLALRVSTLTCIADTIRSRTGGPSADITSVMGDVNALLDASIAADGFRIRDASSGSRVREKRETYGESNAAVDLSAIDFDALAARFKTAMWKNVELEQLKSAVRAHTRPPHSRQQDTCGLPRET